MIPLHNTAHHWALGLVCYPFLAIKTPEGYEADESTAQTEHNSTPFPSYGLNDEDQHTLRRTASQLEAQQVGTVRFPELSPQHKSDSLLMVVCSSDSENDQDAVAENHAQFSVIASGANTMDSSLNSNAYEQNWVTQRVATSAQVVRFQGIPGPAIFYLDSLKDTSGPPPQLKEVIVEYFQEVRVISSLCVCVRLVVCYNNPNIHDALVNFFVGISRTLSIVIRQRLSYSGRIRMVLRSGSRSPPDKLL